MCPSGIYLKPFGAGNTGRFFNNRMCRSAAIILQQIRNADIEVLIYAYRDFVIKRVLCCSGVIFKIIDINRAHGRIHDPVFADPCSTIFKKFYSIVHTACTGRNDFNYPIRCSVTSFVIQLVFVTNHGNVGFHIVPVIFSQEDSEWSRVNFTVSVLKVNIVCNRLRKTVDQFLVNSVWRRHQIHLPVNQLGPLAVWQGGTGRHLRNMLIV